MPSPLALVPSFVSGARDVVSPVEEAENGLADRQREREKKGKKQRKGGIEIEGRPQERRLLLSSTSARVLAALMETRSRELPLTAAKPIYLRPRSLFPSPPSSVLGSLRALPLPSLRRLSSSGPRRIRYPPLARSRSAGLPTRLQRGSCLTRGYFTFPCSPRAP